jgi:hypothetical protein
MNLVMLAYVAVLFYVLSPGIFLRLPEKGSKMMVAAVHGLVFAVVFSMTHKYVWMLSEGFQATAGSAMPSATPAAPPSMPVMATPPMLNMVSTEKAGSSQK